MDAVKSCLKASAVRETLKSLPQTLDTTYERILLTIPLEYRLEALSALKWLVASERPLTLDELAEAAVINLENNPPFDPKQRFFTPESILEVLSTLVVVTPRDPGSGGTHIGQTSLGPGQDGAQILEVRLAHFSVREYFTSSRLAQGPASKFHIPPMMAQSSIAMSCLEYQFCRSIIEAFDGIKGTQGTPNERKASILGSLRRVAPLLVYASTYWSRHALNCEPDLSNNLKDLILRFFVSKEALGMWRSIVSPETGESTLFSFSENQSGPTCLTHCTPSLYYAACLGLTSIATELLKNSSVSVDQEGPSGTPLQIASLKGHEATVLVLLENGADPNARCGDNQSALEAACISGNQRNIRHLIQAGAEVHFEPLLDLISKSKKPDTTVVSELLGTLPQFLLVGDKSSGKSSVLEALSGIRLPRSNINFSRLITRIRLRRSEDVETVIRILPHEKCSMDERKRLTGFRKIVYNQADIDRALESAIGIIFTTGTANSIHTPFILSIEHSGPGHSNLTIVDLPSIIHQDISEAKPANVDAASQFMGYYAQRKHIFLLVASAVTDVECQTIEAAKYLDPTGTRTLGILTKSDLLLSKTPERNFPNFPNFIYPGQRQSPSPSWHVLRNRAPDESHFSLEERNDTETHFFSNSIWTKGLQKSQLGVDALLKKLRAEEFRYNIAEISKVSENIDLSLATCMERLEELGKGRYIPNEMRDELLQYCEVSRRLIQSSAEGSYISFHQNNFFVDLENGNRKRKFLRACVVEQNSNFNYEMRTQGAACLIIEEKFSGTNPHRQTYKTDITIPKITGSQYIETILKPMIEAYAPMEFPGEISQLLVYKLFQAHSRRWDILATEHVVRIKSVCEDFLRELLFHCWPKDLQQRVWKAFVEEELEHRFNQAMVTLKGLLADRLKPLQTYGGNYISKAKMKEEAILESGHTPNYFDGLLAKMLTYYEVRYPIHGL